MIECTKYGSGEANNISLRERHAALQRLLPTARKIQITRSLTLLGLTGVRSVLVIGAADDPYRSCFPNAERYVRLDIENLRRKIDVIADAIALPFPEQCFECVIATEVLEYIFEPQKFVNEMHRVLRLNGSVVLTVPFAFNYHNDYWRPTKRALHELFINYSAASVRAQGNRLFTIWDLITTSFWPHSVLVPLRIFSNLLYIIPARLVCADTKSSAPTGHLVFARK